MEWKYIIVDEMGIETPIIFPTIIDHNSVCHWNGDRKKYLFNNKDIVSAGFVNISGAIDKDDDPFVSISCYGRSTTLDIDSRKEVDNKILNKFLGESW